MGRVCGEGSFHESARGQLFQVIVLKNRLVIHAMSAVCFHRGFRLDFNTVSCTMRDTDSNISNVDS